MVMTLVTRAHPVRLIGQSAQPVEGTIQGLGEGDQGVNRRHLAANFKFPDRHIRNSNQLTKSRLSKVFGLSCLAQALGKADSPVHLQPLDISCKLDYSGHRT